MSCQTAEGKDEEEEKKKKEKKEEKETSECCNCLTGRGDKRAKPLPSFFAEASNSCYCDVDLSEPSPGLTAHCSKGRVGMSSSSRDPFDFKSLGLLTPRRVLATAASP